MLETGVDLSLFKKRLVMPPYAFSRLHRLSVLKGCQKEALFMENVSIDDLRKIYFKSGMDDNGGYELGKVGILFRDEDDFLNLKKGYTNP